MNSDRLKYYFYLYNVIVHHVIPIVCWMKHVLVTLRFLMRPLENRGSDMNGKNHNLKIVCMFYI